MTEKPVRPSKQAIRDVDEIIEGYLEASPESIALGFIEALASGYRHIGLNPGIGSMRYAYELQLPGLRAWPLNQYPQLVFYLEHRDHIDVWRVLHGSRDLPQWIQDDSTIDNS